MLRTPSASASRVNILKLLESPTPDTVGAFATVGAATAVTALLRRVVVLPVEVWAEVIAVCILLAVRACESDCALLASVAETVAFSVISTARRAAAALDVTLQPVFQPTARREVE